MKTIEEFLNEVNTDLDLTYVYQDDMTFDEYEEAIERYIQESSDIIYYSRAIEYLSENDPSLQESLELAADMGYSPADLNSEVLATLLNQQNQMIEWQQVSSQVQEYFDEYENHILESEES
jgi:hypothetical protein